ncbi:arsenate reductase/protein-tyrosine-phosphatase family protein, partial [Faecalibacillus intestinalis]
MKKVAFICVHNSCRSQIAEALGKHLSLDEIKKLIKGVRIGDKIVNPHFHLMDKEAFIKDEGLMCYDIYFYIDLPQIVQST